MKKLTFIALLFIASFAHATPPADIHYTKGHIVVKTQDFWLANSLQNNRYILYYEKVVKENNIVEYEFVFANDEMAKQFIEQKTKMILRPYQNS